MNCSEHLDVEAVATCVSCGRAICDNCRVTLKTESYCRDCVAKMVEGTKKHERSPALATILSFLVGGLGQIYNGQAWKGLAIFLTSWLIIPWIYGIFDANITAHKINEGKVVPQSPQGCAIAAIVAVLMMFVLVPIFALFAAIAIPNFMKARQGAMTHVCRQNLKRIDVAKELWAMDANAPDTAIPTWIDLVPRYLTKKSECPDGGEYLIGSVNSSARCTIGDNKTPWKSDDHVVKYNNL
ncbi:hypothetical protein ACFL3J_01430 [Candidatus Omnitrophota bacterium]